MDKATNGPPLKGEVAGGRRGEGFRLTFEVFAVAFLIAVLWRSLS